MGTMADHGDNALRQALLGQQPTAALPGCCLDCELTNIMQAIVVQGTGQHKPTLAWACCLHGALLYYKSLASS